MCLCVGFIVYLSTLLRERRGKPRNNKTDMIDTRQGDEVNRWNRMFRILFPEVDEEALPSALADEEAPYFSVAAVDPGLQQWEAEVPEEDADVE